MPWRVGLDYVWFREHRAKLYFQRLVSFYAGEWEKRERAFFVEYSYRGDPIKRYESPAAYAMALPAFDALSSPLRSAILKKISESFHPQDLVFQDKQDYYQNSLTLLGLILFSQAAIH